ncbi:peptidase C39 family protein [Streptomyces polyrhachis]|uniref:Peptidase C39 family protein n=1 Tax=Streptomyces polyrhachis TaxID=1282885 RepID=A0ABW2GFI9_9ACTN
MPPSPAAPSRRTLLSAALAAPLAAAVPLAAAPRALGAEGDGPRAAASLVDYHDWTPARGLGGGTRTGTRLRGAALVLHQPPGLGVFRDPHRGTKAAPPLWEYGSWISPRHELPGGGATEAVVSWNVDTPRGSWIQLELRGGYSDGSRSPWLVMGRWASGEGDVKRASLDGQSDGRASVSTDTFALDDPTGSLRLTSYQVRATLLRRPGTRATPRVRRIAVMASALPRRFTVPASTPLAGAGRVLDVPRYSQETHVGQYPQYDEGGEAWCSPTSSQMVVEYWGRRPGADELAWVDKDFADPQVCHAARATYDFEYEGCGNWPFNAAYAATYPGMNAVVTRLRSLNDAERLTAAGIPVITSMSFLKGELRGAGYGTAGHIMVVSGFTADGDVVVNDPAGAVNREVRRVYGRRSFENVWLRTQRRNKDGKTVPGPGGVAYLYWPNEISARQRAALSTVAGIRSA